MPTVTHRDVFGTEIGVGSWVVYPGAQGSSSAYLSVGLVVALDITPGTNAKRIRVRPYGRISHGPLRPFKSLTTRAFWRGLAYAPTIVVPVTAFRDDETRKPMEEFYRDVMLRGLTLTTVCVDEAAQEEHGVGHV